MQACRLGGSGLQAAGRGNEKGLGALGLRPSAEGGKIPAKSATRTSAIGQCMGNSIMKSYSHNNFSDTSINPNARL